MKGSLYQLIKVNFHIHFLLLSVIIFQYELMLYIKSWMHIWFGMENNNMCRNLYLRKWYLASFSENSYFLRISLSTIMWRLILTLVYSFSVQILFVSHVGGTIVTCNMHYFQWILCIMLCLFLSTTIPGEEFRIGHILTANLLHGDCH